MNNVDESGSCITESNMLEFAGGKEENQQETRLR